MLKIPSIKRLQLPDKSKASSTTLSYYLDKVKSDVLETPVQLRGGHYPARMLLVWWLLQPLVTDSETYRPDMDKSSRIWVCIWQQLTRVQKSTWSRIGFQSNSKWAIWKKDQSLLVITHPLKIILSLSKMSKALIRTCRLWARQDSLCEFHISTKFIRIEARWPKPTLKRLNCIRISKNIPTAIRSRIPPGWDMQRSLEQQRIWQVSVDLKKSSINSFSIIIQAIIIIYFVIKFIF